MTARVTTLGTSHGNHTYCRFNTATLVEVGDASYLIDAGSPASALMLRGEKRIQALRGVFLTHMHEDHAGGLPGAIKALLKAPEPGQHTDVFLPEVEARAGLEAWLVAIRLRWPSPLVTLDTVRDGPFYEDDLIRLEATRLLYLKAAWNLDNGVRDPIVSSYAKAFGADSAMATAIDAVQVFGGNGYVKDYPVEKLMRDAKVLQIYEGTSQIQRIVIAKNLLQ